MEQRKPATIVATNTGGGGEDSSCNNVELQRWGEDGYVASVD